MNFQIFSLLFFALIVNFSCGSTATQVTVTETTTSNPPISSTLVPTNVSCEVNSGNCEECVKNKKCYYCETDKKCNRYIAKELIPTAECNLGEVKYTTCAISFKLILILVGILAGVVFIITVCICCWCCCRKKGMKFSKDDLKFARQREERRIRAEERKKERAERTEEIRRKYGLLLDASGLVKDDNPYQRFDA